VESAGGQTAPPRLELVYLWNGFSILGKKFPLVESVYVAVEEAVEREAWALDTQHTFHTENHCLILLLKGICLKYMSAPLAAEDCFRQIIAAGPKLQVDRYLLPYATVELALLLIHSGETQDAAILLETARTGYKDYSLQSRLHFRIHAAQNVLREAGLKQGSGGDGRRPSQLLDDLEECQGKEMVPHI